MTHELFGKRFFIGLLFFIQFVLLAHGSLAGDFVFTLEEGEYQTISQGGLSYGVEVLIVEDSTPPTVTFVVNGKVTPQLIEGASLIIDDFFSISVESITLNEAGEAGGGDTVTIKAALLYCGDSICSPFEDCSACTPDCGCSSGNYCGEDDACHTITCGDALCSDGESCEKDQCCDGIVVKDIMNDVRNCGICNRRCGYKELCISGVCQRPPVCGDTLCDSSERETCQSDCPKKPMPSSTMHSPSKRVKITPAPQPRAVPPQKSTIPQTFDSIEKETVAPAKPSIQQGLFIRVFRWVAVFLKP